VSFHLFTKAQRTSRRSKPTKSPVDSSRAHWRIVGRQNRGGVDIHAQRWRVDASQSTLCSMRSVAVRLRKILIAPRATISSAAPATLKSARKSKFSEICSSSTRALGRAPLMLRKIQSGKDIIHFSSDGTSELVAKPFTVPKRADGSFEVQITTKSVEELLHFPYRHTDRLMTRRRS
jgi:hypothetical protein